MNWIEDLKRWKWAVAVFVGVVMTFVLTVVLAQPLPEVDPSAAGDALTTGISTGGVILICAGAGLLVVWLLRLLLLPKLSGKALAWTATILIGVATFGTTILAAPGKWLEAIFAAVSAGLAAGKAWDLLPDKVTTTMEKPIKKKAAKMDGTIGADDEIVG